MCWFGVLLNCLLSILNGHLSFTLYLDSVGTVLCAMAGGYLPGIVVGVLTNLILSVKDPSTMYFACINAMLAVTMTFLTRRRIFESIKKTLLAIPVIALFTNTLSIILTWALNVDQGASDATKSVIVSFLEDYRNEFCTGYITELLDKGLTIVLVLLIVYIIRSFRPDYFGSIEDVIPDNPKNGNRDHPGTRSFSLRTRMVLLLSIGFLVLAGSLLTTGIILYRNVIIDEHIRLAEGITDLIRKKLDPDRITDYLEHGHDAEGYDETEKELYLLRDSYPDIKYLYVYRILEDGCHVVFDLDTEELEGDTPGTLVDFDPSFKPYLDRFFAGKTIEPMISDDSFGYLLTVYRPLYDRNGDCQCYVAVDLSMVLLSRYIINFVAKFISVFICFYLFFLAIVLSLTEKKLVRPINTMAQVTAGFAYNNEDARRLNVEKIRELDIRTGDEIENLYNAFLKTTEDGMGYVEKLRKAQAEVQDMMKQVAAMDEIAYKDPLTGMKNRAAYEETVRRLEGKLNDRDTRFVFVMIDINFLKKVNDTYGHEFGDIYLINAAKLISSYFGPDVAYRLGGDEFVLLFEGEDVLSAEEKLRSFGDRMSAMQSDDSLEPWEKISAAVGTVVYEPGGFASMEEVLKEADRRMYENKLAMKAARTD